MPTPADYAHASRINEQLRYLDEELGRIVVMQDALDRSRNAAITKRICLQQEIEALKN